MAHKRDKRDKRTKLEIQYEKFFKSPSKQQYGSTPDSLEQPSPLRIVPSVATGAAFEEPIEVN